MLDVLSFLAPPLTASILIVGIHSYLGIHVLKRGIIFVDLALAQIAALGTIVGIIFGILPGTGSSYYFSFLFVVLGAVLFSVTRPKDKRIPQEAIIGIIYGLSIAIAMAIADKISGGGEHIREVLTGNILWVDWNTVLRLAVVYILIAGIHIFFRKHFIALTQDYEQMKASGASNKLWDFLFFFTFGVVITFSVPIAGVLLVFSFLMIPSAISAIFASNWKTRIIIGWIAGVLACFFGLWYSYAYNAPCGPSTVCILALLLLLSGVIKWIMNKSGK